MTLGQTLWRQCVDVNAGKKKHSLTTFVSGLLGNLCYSRSSAASVMTSRPGWMHSRGRKVKNDLFFRHLSVPALVTYYCINSPGELDKGGKKELRYGSVELIKASCDWTTIVCSSGCTMPPLFCGTWLFSVPSHFEQNRVFSLPKSIPTTLDVHVYFLKTALTVARRFESSEQSCSCYVIVRGEMEFLLLCRQQTEIHAARLCFSSSGMTIFIYLFVGFKRQDEPGWEEPLQAGGESSLPCSPPLSASSICILRCSAEWSQRGGCCSALQMNAFSILVVLIKMCALVCRRKRLISRGAPGGGRVSQSDRDHWQTPETQGAEWRREERQRGRVWETYRRNSPMCRPLF